MYKAGISRIVALAGVLVVALGVVTAGAQSNQVIGIHGGLDFVTTGYKKSAARESNTVTRSFGIHGFLESRFYDVVGFQGMLGWEYLGPVCIDLSESSDCDRRQEERTSLIFASIGGVLYGPPLAPLIGQRGFRPVVGFGREWVSRGVGDRDCLNCTLDSVHFDGGMFIEPGLELPAFNDISATLGYRLYQSTADLENRFVLRLSTTRLN